MEDRLENGKIERTLECYDRAQEGTVENPN